MIRKASIIEKATAKFVRSDMWGLRQKGLRANVSDQGATSFAAKALNLSSRKRMLVFF